MNVRDLLRVPDARIDEALAEVMGWQGDEFNCWKDPNPNSVFVFQPSPPGYCSPDSPRRLLEEVEERAMSKEPIGTYGLAVYSLHLDADISVWPAPTIARAALWVLNRKRAQNLIAEVTFGAP